MICVVCQQEDAWATVGAVCERCAGRMASALRALPGLLADLDLEPGRSRSARVSGSREAPLPLRVDPLDLSMPARPASTAVKLRGAWSTRGGDPDQIGHLSVATELDGYARMWAADRHEHGPDPQVPLLTVWLLDRLDWACEVFPAVDEFAATVGRLYGTLTAATGGFPARPETLTAPCPSCGILGLYRDVDIERVACGCCPVLMTDDDYAEYARQLIEEAA